MGDFICTVPWQDEWVENDPDGWSESLDLKCNRSSEWKEVTVHNYYLMKKSWIVGLKNKYISDILHNFYANFPTEWCCEYTILTSKKHKQYAFKNITVKAIKYEVSSKTNATPPISQSRDV